MMYNCDYVASVDWMRYQGAWVPQRLGFKNPYDGRRVEVRPCPESLEAFSFWDVVKNLRWQQQVFEENWTAETVCVLQQEMEAYLSGDFLVDYLKKEEHGWDLVVGATDRATFMYLDRIMPVVVQYLGKECSADTRVEKFAKRCRWRDVEGL